MASQQDIDNANKSIDDLTKHIDELNAKLDGAQCDTLLDTFVHIGKDFNHLIINKKILKVEGGYTKIQVGPSNQIVLGIKGEYIAPKSLIVVLGMETKTVLGLSNTSINGAKSDTILGTKADILLGTKYEKKAEKEHAFGGAPKLDSQGRVLNLLTKMNQKVGSLALKATKAVFKSAAVHEEIGTAKEKVDELTLKHKEFKDYVDSLSTTVDGEYKSEGDEFSLDYQKVIITTDDQIFAVGSGADMTVYSFTGPFVKSGSSSVSLQTDGTVFDGPSFRVL